ncbi:aminoglycoside phosphotransferase family protein [Ruegeria arenilitoris]|uniref:aminoglycoside phosphotransferase family protein n=1 Tax=Ruegeria arenilitoris TaxID=1173585 RepID=UPI001480B1B5|nr:aminoglycoside phosphotransferase family protein [Ruegeria arenilitoris]
MYGGRTNRVWKVVGGDGDKVLKLYNSELRNPLFRNDAELEAQCLHALDSTGFVPRLRAAGVFGPDRWVFYDHAPGTPWNRQAENVGKLLKNLHSLRVDIDAPQGCNGSEDLADHGERILAGCQSKRVAQLRQLRPRKHVIPLTQRQLIHGDPVAGNILVSPTGLTLIDWQCPALGDPCEDLAMFLSPAMQQLYRGQPLSASETAEFLSGYDQSDVTARYEALRPWYAWRMAAYCLWRAETGAVDYNAGYELEIAALL